MDVADKIIILHSSMTKKLSALLLIFTSSFLFISTPQITYAAVSVSITAPSAVLYDMATGNLVYSKTPHIKRAPASTAKILTAIVVMDALPLNRIVTIPKFAESVQPSKIHLRHGEKYYVRDLLRATLISSANDAAEVLGVAAGGSRAKFSEMLNRKARAIGCKDSHFIRPSGLPAKNQYSTAYDMALIAKHAQKYPFIVNTLKQKSLVIKSHKGRKIYLKNHNKMLWKDSREVIGKTGWTRTARHCFVGHIGLWDRKVVVSMLGSHSLWRDLKKLVDYQFGTSLRRVATNQKIWSTSETKKIQVALKNAGFNPGPADGEFGPQTLGAVRSFQRTNGLDPDGVVGTLTWKKLQAYL